MITPQQIEQISFDKASFGGYKMKQVDEILEPLTEDYTTLYKENALLKSKMRVLVGKLEEYRKNEAAVKEAAANAKKACDRMIQEAQESCAKMMAEAEAAKAAAAAAPASAPVAGSTDELVEAENARLAEAKKLTAARINEIQEQMRSCIKALDRIKSGNAPTEENAASDNAVANEISQSLEALVGTTSDTAPKAAPLHPSHDSTTSRFSTLNLQFGRNYDPTH